MVRNLTRIVSLCFENGVSPSAFKRVRAIFLFKGGSRNGPANYRLIFLLAVFSKIFELPK